MHSPSAVIEQQLSQGWRVGPYEVEGYLGQGGLGVVVRARHRLTGRPVAIKLLNHTSDEENVEERLFREARIAMQLNHPNIVTMYDFGIDDGRPYLVMELLEGTRLSQIMALDEPADCRAVIDWFVQLADALACAHQQGTLHRDIKPGNIMIVEGPHGESIAKLIDFGLSKSLTQHHETITATGHVVGTPAYMSPEQCMGRELDERSDVYSLGCVMYELLTGQSMVQGTGMEAMFQHVQKDARFDEKSGSHVPAPLQEVALKALEKRSSDRYTAIQLRDALKDLRDRDLSKRSVGCQLRLRMRALRRIFDAKLLIAIAAVVTVSGIIAFWDGGRRATPELDPNARNAQTLPPVTAHVHGLGVVDDAAMRTMHRLQLIHASSGPEGYPIGAAMADLDATNFSELDKLFAELAKDKSELSDGMRKIDKVEHGLAILPVTAGPQSAYWMRRLQQWAAANPKSPAANSVLADALGLVAWTDYHSTWFDMTAHERRALDAHLGEALSLSHRAQALAPDSEVAANVRLRLALLQSMTRHDYEMLYDSLVKRFPGYKMLPFLRAIYLERQWHGADGEWQAFAWDATSGGQDETLFTQICWYVFASLSPYDTPQTSGVSWDVLKKGFGKLVTSPNSSFSAASECCALSCIYGDKATARRMFDEYLHSRVDLSVWQSPTEFMSAYQFATK